MAAVLLVEDEARMRDIVRDYFTAHGLDCDLAQLVTGVSIRQKRFKGGAEQLVERMDGGQRHLLLASG